jgi:hypothetical protein
MFMKRSPWLLAPIIGLSLAGTLGSPEVAAHASTPTAPANPYVVECEQISGYLPTLELQGCDNANYSGDYGTIPSSNTGTIVWATGNQTSLNFGTMKNVSDKKCPDIVGATLESATKFTFVADPGSVKASFELCMYERNGQAWAENPPKTKVVA